MEMMESQGNKKKHIFPKNPSDFGGRVSDVYSFVFDWKVIEVMVVWGTFVSDPPSKLSKT